MKSALSSTRADSEPASFVTHSGELSITAGMAPPFLPVTTARDRSSSHQLSARLEENGPGWDEGAIRLDQHLARLGELGQVEILLVLRDVQPLELDLGWDAQEVELLQHERRHPAGQESERQEC